MIGSGIIPCEGYEVAAIVNAGGSWNGEVIAHDLGRVENSGRIAATASNVSAEAAGELVVRFGESTDYESNPIVHSFGVGTTPTSYGEDGEGEVETEHSGRYVSLHSTAGAVTGVWAVMAYGV